jgi:hypothetical protein
VHLGPADTRSTAAFPRHTISRGCRSLRVIAEQLPLPSPPAGFPPFDERDFARPSRERWIAIQNPRGDNPGYLHDPRTDDLPNDARLVPRRGSFPLWIRRPATWQKPPGAWESPESARERASADASGLLYQARIGLVALFRVNGDPFEEDGWQERMPLQFQLIPHAVAHSSLRPIIRPLRALKDQGFRSTAATPHLAQLQRQATRVADMRSWRELMTLVVRANPGWRPGADWVRKELDLAFQ